MASKADVGYISGVEGKLPGLWVFMQSMEG